MMRGSKLHLKILFGERLMQMASLTKVQLCLELLKGRKAELCPLRSHKGEWVTPHPMHTGGGATSQSGEHPQIQCVCNVIFPLLPLAT